MPRVKRSFAQMRASLKLLKDKKNLVGVEVGVSDGSNAKVILENLDIKKLYLVDIWASYYEGQEFMEMSKNLKSETEKRLKAFKQVIFIQKDSIEAPQDFKDNFFDFVYIDANHEYRYIRDDILAWKSKVKNGGMLAGHDFGKEDIAKAVNEIFPDRKTDQGDWWIIK